MSLAKRLERLHALILEERHYAKHLDLDMMVAASRAKEELLPALQGDPSLLGAEELTLIRTIREENRRNAYLFLAALNWVRDTMRFFGQKTSPVSYSGSGTLVSTQAGGKLLSGRV